MDTLGEGALEDQEDPKETPSIEAAEVRRTGDQRAETPAPANMSRMAVRSGRKPRGDVEEGETMTAGRAAKSGPAG